MTECVIFDLDGTIVDCQHRRVHITGGKKDWDTFFQSMTEDTPNYPVYDLYKLVRQHLPIVICTARSEDYSDLTQRWLDKFGVTYSAIYFRPKNDYRADYVVKREMYDRLTSDGWEPKFVVDDRKSVVDVWRDAGLCCLQCAPGDFELPLIEHKKDQKLLTLMVGPSGGGKTYWLKANGYYDQSGLVISSDVVRQQLCGDFRDQSKNDLVFSYMLDHYTTRLKYGLHTIIDATNLKKKDRMNFVNLLPKGAKGEYLIVNRPMEQKYKDGGWRNELDFDLIEKHERKFRGNLQHILEADQHPDITVHNVYDYYSSF